MSVPSETTLGLRFVFFRVCAIIAAASLVANFLPDSKRFAGRPKAYALYCFFVDYVAFFALNFRIDLPSLDQEFLGFRRTIRHGIRNWRQNRMDRQV